MGISDFSCLSTVTCVSVITDGGEQVPSDQSDDLQPTLRSVFAGGTWTEADVVLMWVIRFMLLLTQIKEIKDVSVAELCL